MPHPTATHPVILFDGVCNLCSDSVRFVVARDPDGVFRFASLQSEVGQALLARFGLPRDDFQTLVLIEDDRILTKSAAVLAIASRLRSPWRSLRLFRLLPRPLRDALYDLMARHRYAIFGRDNRCLVPTPALRARLLDDGYEPPA